MKRLQQAVYAGVLGCTAMTCTTTALAQAISNSNTPTATNFCGAQPDMDPSEQIRQLTPAKSPTELLQLLRQLHDNFLLLDPSFIEDENLQRLFGPGDVRVVRSATPLPHVWREIDTYVDRGLKTPLSFSFLHKSKSRDGKSLADVSIFFKDQDSPYTSELIEQYLVPDARGSDPFGSDQSFQLTNEAKDAALRRRPATHPKGYFQYELIKETSYCRSAIFVRLHQNGTVWDIKLDQKQQAK